MKQHIFVSGTEFDLPIGEHFYPFNCALPPTLPSSFEHDYGYVRYTVKATIDRPWKFDHEVKTAFTVVSNFDLNKEPRAAVIIIFFLNCTRRVMNPSTHFSIPPP